MPGPRACRRTGRREVLFLKTVRIKSVVPIYAVAVLWIVWALFFAMYNVMSLAGLVASSFVVYLCVNLIFPGKFVQVAEPKTTGNAGVDALVAEGDKAVAEMRRLNGLIPGETISAQIDELERTAGKIFSYVADHPAALPQIRKFLRYYLPTTIKLLDAYARMDSQGVEGENINATKKRVEDMMETIVTAFHRQLDALFGAEALDISTDIKVLETMMAREGLTDEGRLRAEQ